MQTGDVLRGKYRLVRLLGDGGMGSVYEALHAGLGTRVAIKVLHPDLARRPGLVERFLREARVSAQIKSPNVVQVMDVEATEDGVAYIVMELLEGEPLSAVLERQGKLGVGTACDYAGQILRALEAAHALGVVHRDLKPENVFVITSSPPFLKLIDFGIAKARQMDSQARNLTIAGVVMGTPEYMAPEQAHSADKVDARSDLFAVGVMLYEMISGSRPATGDDARLVALKVERGDIRPLVHAAPGVPPDLAGLVHRAMAPRPELRFGSASEMRAALEAVGGAAGKRPSEAAPAPAPAVRTDNMALVPPATDRASALPASRAMAPVASLPAAGRATIMSDPTGESFRSGPQADPYASAWPGGQGGYPIPQAPPAQAVRGRGRRQGSAIWLLFAIPLLLGGGIVAAFALSNSSSSTNAATSSPGKVAPPPPVNVAPTPSTPSPPPSAQDPGSVPPLSPLNNPQAGPAPHPGPGPGPVASGTKPHPSASASAGAAPPAPPDSPFPFPSGFPTIPNPFPSPTSSGVGPVITIPTGFPFPFPGSPAPAPSPSGSPAPTPSGKTI